MAERFVRPVQIAVIGSGGCQLGSEPAALAEEVGRLLAEEGALVVCGGLGGVMEAVSRGAAGAGGSVLGIVPGHLTGEANPYCTHVVATAVGQARNLAVVASGEAVIAVAGEWGTLSEIALARSLGRPVITLESWRPRGRGEMATAPGMLEAADPAEAVRLALGAAAD